MRFRSSGLVGRFVFVVGLISAEIDSVTSGSVSHQKISSLIFCLSGRARMPYRYACSGIISPLIGCR